MFPETYSKQGANKSEFRPSSVRLPPEAGYFLSNPAAFLKQVFLSTSGITEKRGNEDRSWGKK